MAEHTQNRFRGFVGLLLTIALFVAATGPAMAASYQIDPDGLQRIGSLLDPDG